MLRNTGYLEKLADIKQNVLTKNLTLENVSMYSPDLETNINETSVKDTIKLAVRRGTLALGMVVAVLASGISSQEAIRDFQIPTDLVQKAQQFIQTNVMDDLGFNDENNKEANSIMK